MSALKRIGRICGLEIYGLLRNGNLSLYNMDDGDNADILKELAERHRIKFEDLRWYICISAQIFAVIGSADSLKEFDDLEELILTQIQFHRREEFHAPKTFDEAEEPDRESYHKVTTLIKNGVGGKTVGS